MSMARSATFLVHLLQDVQILRPLIFMARRDFGFDTQILVSDKFRARDTSRIWLGELEAICAETGARLHFFRDEWEARDHLKGQGLLFAASESNVPNHLIAHNVFRCAPPTYLKVTLQHGFECIGFRHSEDHMRVYGESASFAADILCAWYGADRLTALAPSQASKVIVTGPTSILQMATGAVPAGPRPGLVCENLHSIRFGSEGKLEQEFLGTFRKFALAMYRQGQSVRLRPHPGGQYSAKSGAVLPINVQLENAPLYRLDLRQFAYGISPPSSVLIDMLLADIPTAVWRDKRGHIDVANYEGLMTVTSADELVGFAQDAQRHRERLLKRQRAWLESQGMPTVPADVYDRYAQLFESAERMTVRPPGARIEKERILVLTSQGFDLPQTLKEGLAALMANGVVLSREVSLEARASVKQGPSADHLAADSVEGLFEEFDPSVIFVLGRALGAYESALLWAKDRRVPVIYIVGDSLDLTSEATVSGSGWKSPALSNLLQQSDLIYAPSEQQRDSLERAFPDGPLIAAATHWDDRQYTPPTSPRHELWALIASGHRAVGLSDLGDKKEVRVCQGQ